ALQKQYQYHIDYGILCENCLNPNIANHMPVAVFSILFKIQYGDPEKMKNVQFNQADMKKGIELLLDYLENHLNKQLNLKSLKQLHG
ncbi:MAG: hypothetical protein KDD94_04490, partial [Calditrichaeota bacterium]|nr:hypothetical protein [Calditrichota bacterium]